MIRKLFVFALFFIPQFLFSQILKQVDSVSTKLVSAEIRADGSALVSNFYVPEVGGDTVSHFSMLDGLYLWMGGVDPAGNLKLAVQSKNSAFHGFTGGFRGIPNSSGVWKVTRDELDKHFEDWKDNGIVDNPIQSIFSWPGSGNPNSPNLNGFSLENLDRYILAPQNSSGWNYDPKNGGTPNLTHHIISIERPVAEILYTPFYTSEINPIGTESFKVDCSTTFVSYHCDSLEFLQNQIFGFLSIVNKEPYPIDSFFVSFFVDGNIGNPFDDFLGTVPNSWAAYFFNSDSLDENGFGKNPPGFAINMDATIVGGDTSHFDFAGVSKIQQIMPFPDSLSHSAWQDPQANYEFYNYITGSWRDRTPLTAGGNGYNLNPNIPNADFIFPGNPNNLNEWSEISAGNPPGDRRAILSVGPVKLYPGIENTVAFILVRLPNGKPQAARDTLIAFGRKKEDFLYTDFFEDDPFKKLSCFKKTTPVNSIENNIEISIFPNPISDNFYLKTNQTNLSKLLILDIFSKEIYRKKLNQIENGLIEIENLNFQNGLYFVLIELENGERISKKIVVQK